MSEISTAGIFQIAFIIRQMEQTPQAFFQTTFEPSVGCVPQGTHAAGWGCRDNGERVRAYRTHPTCGLRLALSQDRWNKCRKRFFRRPLNPSVGCVPQGARGGLGCRENGERVRAYRTHPTYGLRLATACWLIKQGMGRKLKAVLANKRRLD